jgi:hypothetical protein
MAGELTGMLNVINHRQGVEIEYKKTECVE